ncbi:MAG: lipid A biosynthesis acyltransferase [Gammaproteobacteria bacterium]|nr:lipid A biosynthesis acyltransferase [Gammaproteobacteria bacterium]
MSSTEPNAADWQTQPERGSPFLVWLIRWIALHLGRRPARVLLYPITLYFFLFAPTPRRASRAYLSRLWGRPARHREVFRHIHCFASATLDRVFQLAGRDQALDIQIHGLKELEACLDRNQGVLILSAHLGSFESLRALARRRPGLDIRVLMEAGQNPMITGLLHELAPDIAERVIPLGGVDSLIRIEAALREGAIVGVLADRRVAGDRSLQVPFLGQAAAFPQGPFLLPLLTGAPVVLAFGLHDGGNRYDLHFEVIPTPGRVGRGHRQAEMQRLAEAFAGRMEHHLRRAPYNWFNFYDFWGNGA